MPRHHVRVEMYYPVTVVGVERYQWVPQLDPGDDSCAAALSRDPVVMTAGRTPQQNEPVAASGSLTFKGHTHNPRNPASALYGRIGENTPIRILVGDRAALVTDFSYSASNSWAGGPLTWINIGTAADYDVNGSEATHTHPSANVTHVSFVDTGSLDHLVRATWDLDTADLTGAGCAVAIRGRAVDADNNYQLNVTYDTLEQVTVALVKRDGGATTILDTWSGSINLFGAGTIDMMGELYIEGPRIYGKVWRRLNDFEEPLEWQVSAVDDALTDGTLAGVSSLRATGNTNANLTFRFHDFMAAPGTLRYAGEVKRYAPQRNMGGDTWVGVELHDALGRLEKAEPLRSALWRENLLNDPLAFWPLNDGPDVPAAATPVPGGLPIPILKDGPLELRQINAWTEPILTPRTGEFVTYNGYVGQDPAATEWAGDFVFAVDTDAEDADLTFSLEGPPTNLAGVSESEWILTLEAIGTDTWLTWELIVRSVTNGALSQTSIDSGTIAKKDGALHHARLITNDSGDWTLSIDNGTEAFGTTSEPWLPVQTIRLDYGTETAGQMTAGQVVVWGTDSPPFNAANAAVVGRSGELAAERLARLFLEEGIPFELVGDSADTGAMGPQLIDTLAVNAAACEAVDMGYLTGSRHQNGLTYRTRVDLYNQTPVTLDAAAGGEVGDPLNPEIGDLGLANDVTVKRPNGASRRSVLETGPLSVQAPPLGAGRYAPPDLEANVDTDAQLRNIADWRRYKGTQGKIRYPQVTVDFDALGRDGKTDLARAVARMRVGDRLDVDNLEAEGVRQITPGYTEAVGPGDIRKITFNGEPASIYDLGIYSAGTAATRKRWSSAYSTTAAQITTGTSTSLSVAVEAGRGLWNTGSSAPQFPFDIDLLGARVTVTAISGASSPQTFTISTTVVNGINKIIPSGTSVRPWDEVRYAP